MKLSYLLLIALLFLGFEQTLNAQVDVIYGADNRYEVSEFNDNFFVEKAKSVAIKVATKRLTVDRKNPDFYNFPQITLKQAMPLLCEEERFIDQVTLGSCSGFLIAKNKIVTVGHCMLSQSDCNNNKWIFDYTEGTTQIKKENTYSCKKIISQQFNYTDPEIADYAVIELDREVSDREPLEYRKSGVPFYNTSVVVIGHPLGLPMKIADGSRVTAPNDEEIRALMEPYEFQKKLLRDMKNTDLSNKSILLSSISESLTLHKNLLSNLLHFKKTYFTTNIDSFAGNSGSPVFNKITGKVEGIVMNGADDFREDKERGCIKSVRLSNKRKVIQEKVMRITKVKF